MLCLLYPTALLAAGVDSVLTFAAFDQSRQGFWQNKKAEKDILHKWYVHQVLIKSLYLYQKEGKGRSIYRDKKGGKVTAEEMGTGTAAAAGQESDTRETTVAKANP